VKKRTLLTFAQCVAVAAALSCAGPAAPSAPPPTPQPPVPSPPPAPIACSTSGVSCFGKNNYIEYIPGDLPIVISVPHGGALTPASIPDRTFGTNTTDLNTIDLGRAISSALTSRSARAPHLVIVHLRRTKLDANREIIEAAAGNAEAIQAWNEYHAFIEQAMAAVQLRSGTGLYIDLHGHGHTKQRLELGYLLSASTLDGTNAQLDATAVASASSLRLIAQSSPLLFSELLRGPTSLGGFLQPDIASVPSPSIPTPGADDYFSGGYSTSRHTTTIPGLQIECNFSGVRDSANSRASFATRFVQALALFAQTHLSLKF